MTDDTDKMSDEEFMNKKGRRNDAWSEEEVEEFVRRVESEDYDIDHGKGGDSEPPAHVGAVFTGLFLVFVVIYSIYVGEWSFAGLNCTLLVVLALGSKGLN